MSDKCLVYRLGLVPYHDAWHLQEQLAVQIAASSHPPCLLLLQHPNIYTFGRRGVIANLLWDESELSRREIEVAWVDRGGDVTYHGPGQLVGYPLLPLVKGGWYAGTVCKDSTSTQNKLPEVDIMDYLRNLEQVVIQTLASFGIQADQVEGKTGVWLKTANLEAPQPPAKIASIGVKVDGRGTTRHGFAINVDPDMSYWEGIIACGLAGYPAASMADLLHPVPPMETVEQEVIRTFGEVFKYEMVESDRIDI